MAQKGICQNQSKHSLTYRHSSNAYAGIMASLGANFHVMTVAIN
jgi:hypothetical protein